jgi:hypothetical protein
MIDLKSAVIQLHDVARLVESEVGQGELSKDIRTVADRLERVISPLAVEVNEE